MTQPQVQWGVVRSDLELALFWDKVRWGEEDGQRDRQTDEC